jgi:peptide/nickel transport system permease protein
MAELAISQPRWRTFSGTGSIRWCLIFARRKPLSAFGAVVIVTLCLLVYFGPFLLTTSPYVGVLRDHLQAPSTSHILGTDEQGRDLLTRTLYGGRTSMAVGFGGAFFATLAGTTIGLISGYTGGKVDLFIQRVMDALMSLPPIILLMVLASVLTPSLKTVVFAISILFAPSVGRVMRSAVLTVKEEPYVEAAHSLGASSGRVMVRHILPNVIAPMIIILSIGVGGAIITEAALGFLGLSVGPPKPTWGNMLNAGAQSYMEQAPWLAIVPGVAIAMMVFAVNLFGDGLRDMLDPRLRGKGRQ